MSLKSQHQHKCHSQQRTLLSVETSIILNFDFSALKWSNNTPATQSWVSQNTMMNNSPTINGTLSMNAGQPISWLAGACGGSIIAGLVNNVGGYIALNALQGGTFEVFRARYVNGAGPSCLFSATEVSSLPVHLLLLIILHW